MDQASASSSGNAIPAKIDENGTRWGSTTKKSDEGAGLAICRMVPDRVIPIIFVPGVMGSNLIGKNGVKWRLDSAKTMLPWMFRGAEKRKKYLKPSAMDVDDGGVLPDGTALTKKELFQRKWGEIGNMSYGEFLVWLEHNLNDFDNPANGVRESLLGRSLGAEKGEEAITKTEVGCSYRYAFPVYACGYNWLDSNVAAAERLKARIEEVVDRYTSEKKKCEKVIVVTHSMGGLVARHCSEVLGMKDKIFGIVHGVMPAIGAAAVYRRMKAGTENGGKGFLGWLAGWAAGKALGEDAAEMTAVLSSAPGPLQLLPTPEYGNGWMRVKFDNVEYFKPTKNDPYTDIYTVRGEWWSMCEDHLIDPTADDDDPQNAERRKARLDKDWEAYLDIIYDDVLPFHVAIANQYHANSYVFYGSDEEYKAYGTVTWTGKSSLGEDWLRGNRPVYPMAGKALDPTEVDDERTIAAPLGGSGWKKGVHQTYTLSDPDEDGDGTVPRRSGLAPKEHSGVKQMLRVSVGHEPAYKESEAARLFTVRSVVKIAQAVAESSLAYK